MEYDFIIINLRLSNISSKLRCFVEHEQDKDTLCAFLPITPVETKNKKIHTAGKMKL